MYQEGEISTAQCAKCGEKFPVFTFKADTDMVTNGCVSLTAKGNRVALAVQATNETDSEIEARIGNGYKIIGVRFLKTGSSTKGISFQDFIKTYKPLTPIYTCLSCGSDSAVIKTETKDQFLTHGTIEVINGS